jgi:hypothetical protein
MKIKDIPEIKAIKTGLNFERCFPLPPGLADQGVL